MALRKVLISTEALTNNAGSFTNVTNDRYHIRKIIGRIMPNGVLVIADDAHSSLDELNTTQRNQNDSRAHIATVQLVVMGGTGTIRQAGQTIVLSFGRNDLVLDADESFFVNNEDANGAPAIRANWNLWYEE